MRLLSRPMRNMRNVNPTKKTQMMINGWNTVWFVCPLSWSTDAEVWSVAFLMTCLRNRNGCSPQKSAFIMITTTVLWYLGFLMNLYFISFSLFFLLSRQSPPTDWLTLFEVNLVPRAFYLRKWLEDTRLEATLAQGKGRGEEGVLPGVFGGEDEQPGSPYPELISNQICSFSTHFQAGSQNTEYW